MLRDDLRLYAKVIFNKWNAERERERERERGGGGYGLNMNMCVLFNELLEHNAIGYWM